MPETMKIHKMNLLNIDRMMVCETIVLMMKVYL